ncbi:TonB-dependent receptor [Aurantiacibacter flavus]|uniref:TonB-dependent receptor n=1 Tax=Aurantiacibacter flavus TaxID=3145232 RepID=A0ABV0CWX2_9SPHN
MTPRNFARVASLGTASLVALAVAAPALAQDAGQADDDMIIVTANKRAQDMQDVSVAVSAVGGELLADRGISNLADIQSAVPSVTFGNDFNQAKVFIRGVGANTSTTGSSTGVAMHVDGAYVARAEAQLTSMFDLERVEVLRGPQGSLYGRNAVGGSINLITRKPTDYLTVDAQFTLGNYETKSAEVGIGGPITDGVMFRLAGRVDERAGYGVDPVNGWDVDDNSRQMVRGQLLFDFDQGWDLLLSAEYYGQHDNSGAVHYSAPAFPGVARLAPIGAGGFATDPRDLSSDEPPSVDTETYSFTANLGIDLNENLRLTNLANYRKFDTQLIQDLDISAVVNRLPQATTVQTRTIDAEQFSNELQLAIDTDFVTGVAGLYYFNERQKPRDQVGLSSTTGMQSNITTLATRPVVIDGTPAPVGSISLAESLDMCAFQAGAAPNRVCLRSNLGTEAYAAFGQLNFDMAKFGLDGVSIKVGGRWSHEEVDSRNPSIIMTANANPAVSTILVNTNEGTFTERTFEDFTPELGISWEPNSDMLFYYTYSEGFKAGSGENAAGSTTIVDPESVVNHEIGAKLQLFDRMLTLNLAGYTYELTGLQINKTVGGGPAGFTTIFENAAETSATGFEADFVFSPVDVFRLSGGLSYTDSKYDDFVTLDPLDPVNVSQPGQPAYDPVTNPSPTAFGGPCPADSLDDFGPCRIQLAGNPTRNTPEWSYNLRAELDASQDLLGGTLTLAGDMYGRSDVFFTEFNRLVEGSEAYTMFDASLRWEDNNGGLYALAYVRNIGDTLRRSSTFALSTGRVIGATYLPPRTYGLTLGYRY